MSFLSGAFLLALPLLAVPVAIHLYRGRQRDVIFWGAMQFLATAATKGRRMERLEELALMALRLAAVAALVFALARPMIRSQWLSGGADQQLVLVLDNSLSMARTVNGESCVGRMKRQADELVDSLTGSAGVQILLAAGNEWATADSIVGDALGKQQLRAIVDGLEPTEGSADLLACLQAALHLESNDAVTSRRIVVFTDSQARSWQLDAEAAWRQVAGDRGAADPPTSLEVVECGTPGAPIENLAVTEVAAARNLIQPGGQIELSAEIQNTGDAASQAIHAEWLLGDKVVQEAPVGPLAPHAKTRITATLRLPSAGITTVACRIDGVDQVALDQTNSMVVEVADELPILVVHADDENSAGLAAPALFAAALGYKGDAAQAWHSVFRPEVIAPAELAARPLSAYRAVLINNPGALDRAALEALDTFVRSGGGLWLALGDHTDPEAFNRDFFADGDGLSPLPLDGLQVIAQADDAAATVHPPSREHPATAQLSNTTQLDVDDARLRQHWNFAARSAGQEEASVLLESGNGQPLVVENYVGQGRVLVQAFPLGVEWGNLPLLKAYVVMVHDWLDYVTAPTSARYNLSPGAPIVATAPAGRSGVTAQLVTPRERVIPLAASNASEPPVFRSSQTQLPGAYRVRFASSGKPAGEAPFQVAREAAESDLRVLTDSERAQLTATAGVRFGKAEPLETAAPESAPQLEPVWGWLLAALVALLAVELLVANLLARRRFGVEVTTS